MKKYKQGVRLMIRIQKYRPLNFEADYGTDKAVSLVGHVPDPKLNKTFEGL